MRFHYQNLNERKDGTHGSIIKQGRMWIYLGKITIHLHWSFGGDWCLAHINIGAGDSNRDLAFSIGVPFVGLFGIHFERLLPEWLVDGEWTKSYLHPGEMFKVPIERQIGFSIYHDTLWVSLWENPMGSSRKDARWWKFNWTPADTLFGDTKHSKRILSETRSFVWLPEAAYPVNVTIFESIWKRPRWPWDKKMIRAKVEAVDQEHGIPSHAGKGENSWDLDDDALFSMTCLAETPEDAVRQVARNILNDRKRYGKPSLGK